MTTTERPPVPPIVCEPWCTVGNGHPHALFAGDQTCWGSAGYVMLSLEDADQGIAGEPYPARIGAMPCRYNGGQPLVYLHTELCGSKRCDTAAYLTAEEARLLAESLLTAAEDVGRRP